MFNGIAALYLGGYWFQSVLEVITTVTDINIFLS